MNNRFTLICASLLLATSQNSPAAETTSTPAMGSTNPNLSLGHEVRRAMTRGSEWLQKNQNPDGSWSTPDHPAVTALALVALRGADPTATVENSPVLRRGYQFIVESAQPDGGIYRKRELVTYNTAISMLALIAAGKAEYQPIILKARQFLVGLQSDFGERGKTDHVYDGGIGYGSRYDHSDMSNTAQALEALYYSRQLAKDQGLPDLNWDAAIHFLQNCQNLPEYNKQPWASGDPQNRGGFVYYPGASMAGEVTLPSGRVALRSYGSISYAGLLSYMYSDLTPDDPRVSAVFEWLKANYTLEENPGMGPQGLFYYYHTMAKALNLLNVEVLELKQGGRVKWREALATRLVGLQQQDGSWINENNRWWERDPALVTSYALISLGIIQRQ
jgi:squalene-hopene/tetraprenyl-beta-curcumene cyclase